MSLHFRFGRLSTDDQEDFSLGCRLFEFQEGDILAFPGDQREGPFLIASGVVEVLGPEGCATELLANSTWGAESFWQITPESSLLRAKSLGAYILIPTNFFLDWARCHRQIVAHLACLSSETDPIWTDEKIYRLWLEPPKYFGVQSELLEENERVSQVLHRSRWLSMRSMILPAFFLVLSGGYFLFIQQHPSFSSLAIFPVLLAVLSSSIGLILVWVHTKSYLVLTNQALVIRNFDLFKQSSTLQKIHLSDLRNVVSTHKGWQESLFRFTDLTFETTHGKFSFNGASRGQVLDSIVSACGRPSVVSETLSPRDIREILVDTYGNARRPQPIWPKETSPKSNVGKVWKVRQHLAGLVWSLHRALGILLLLVIASFVGVHAWPDATSVFLLLISLVATVPTMGVIWQILLWRNSFIQVDSGKISIVKRHPLRLAEEKNQGELLNIQEIQVEQKGLAQLLFDFGDLSIQLGGVDNLVLAGIAHPHWVQSEIFRRQQLLKTETLQNQALGRAQEVVKILKTWEIAREMGWLKDQYP